MTLELSNWISNALRNCNTGFTFCSLDFSKICEYALLTYKMSTESSVKYSVKCFSTEFLGSSGH